MWIKAEDGSILDINGNVVWFSVERFIEDIGKGNCCFLCGAKRGSKKFNDEHVLPDWLLSHYSLKKDKIRLPNGFFHNYGTYKTPCCVDCNSKLGIELEAPISQAVKAGGDSLTSFINEGGFAVFYVWMACIFLKVHLKDKKFRNTPDKRIESGEIGDSYNWEWLHHMHVVVKSFMDGYTIDNNALGTWFNLITKDGELDANFDFLTFHNQQSMMIKLDGMAYFAVFDDACGAGNLFWNAFRESTGLESHEHQFTMPQAREVLVEISLLNDHLEFRPTFETLFDMRKEELKVIGNIPSILRLARPIEASAKNAMMAFAFSSLPGVKIEVDGVEYEADKSADVFEKGVSFLFGTKGLRVGNHY